jgi:hypothetical protein
LIWKDKIILKTMPKEKILTKCIPKIYKRNAENIMLFSWVRAQRQIVPTVTLDQAITNYFRFACISQEEWDLDSARSTFIKLQKDYFEDCQS